MTSISRPGGTSVYIKQESGTISWSSDNINFITISSFPVTVTNTNTGAGILTVVFTTNLTLSNTGQYFSCGSTNIQFGSDTLNTDGSRPTIFVPFDNYDGFIDNSSGSTGFNNITIKNIVVDGTGYTLQVGAGWVGKLNFARGATNNQIINCSSKGNISGSGGGIVGEFSCYNANSSLTITNCTSTGDIGNGGGGIIGTLCAGSTNSSITITGCSSSGSIAINAGGITGNSCGINGGSVSVTNSYSTGSITGGGIFGITNGYGTNGSATATNCYSTGAITGGGGIFAGNAGQSGGSATATNCFSTGLISSGSGGIFGSNYTTAIAYNCYTTGARIGGSDGGIWYNSLSDNLQGANNYSEANHSSSGWNDVRAKQYLTGEPISGPVGSTWAQLNGPNTAYILAVGGYSPYSTTLGTTASSSITAGGTTAPAVNLLYTFSLLAINGSAPNSFPSFSIGTNGAITADSSTPPAVYTISIYASINPYSITTYTLTVSAVPVTADSGSTAEGVSCCAVPMNIGTDVDYETRNKFVTGNTMIGGVRGRQPYASYTMLLYKQMAFAAKR